MRISRPSPAMVVSIIALVIATAGTAGAASGILIRSSSQVAPGALSGTDLHAKTIKNGQLASSAVDSRVIKANSIARSDLSSDIRASLAGTGTAAGFTAVEAVRKDGPQVNQTGQATVAKLSGLAAGTYLISAKSVLSGVQPPGSGLVTELLKPNKTAAAHCHLDAAGDSDDAYVPIAFPFALNSDTIHLQLTRSLAATSDVVLTCDSDISWRAANTSIVALKLSGSTRVDSAG